MHWMRLDGGGIGRPGMLVALGVCLAFQNMVAKSPLQYLWECRMQKAGDLLTQSRKGIKQIARQVGYSTAAAFSNAFKRWSGTSPAAYRRQFLPNRRASGADCGS